jgi:GNAT superfamily N-acetyltransferase
VTSSLSSGNAACDRVVQPRDWTPPGVSGRASEYVARWYRPEDKPEILRLNALYGRVSELAQSDYFDWLYEHNPAGRPTLSVAAEETDGKLVGFIWYIPVRLRCFGTCVTGFLGANALVHPDYRRQNVYSTLQKMAVEECIRQGATLLYAFGRPLSMKAAQPLGFEGINMPLLVRPFDIDQLAQARGFGTALRKALSLGWRLAEATVCRPRTAGGNLTVRHEAEFDESFDRFWQRLADKYPVAVMRDRMFLTWRFCSVPFRQYVILSARDRAELVGYAVLRSAEVLGVPTGLVMDLLVEPTARGEEAGLLLLAAAMQRFRDAGAWMSTCLMLSHTQEYHLLRRAGYVPCQRWLAPRPYLLAVRGCSEPVSPGRLADRSHHLFVTLANHDAC